MMSLNRTSRRVADMSVERLHRKRAIDRENQRNLRQMNKGRIRELEAEIEKLRHQIDASGDRESLLQLQLSSARTQVNSVIQTLQAIPFDAALDAAPKDETLESNGKGSGGFGPLDPNDPPSTSIDLSSCFSLDDPQDLDSQFWTHGGSIAFPLGDSDACDASDFSLDLSFLAPSSTDPSSFHILTNHVENTDNNMIFQLQTPPEIPTATQEDFHASRLEANRLKAQNPIWASTPTYSSPICPIDRLIIDLIESRKLHNQLNPDLREFSHKNFPSVDSLLNPSLAEPDDPVASTLAKHVAGVIRVHTLPEKLALLYIMCVLIRWQVLPTEEHYMAIPEFARPTLGQIVVPHPPWVGTIGWPRARDQIIRHMDFTDYPRFASSITKCFSINWPFGLTGILERGTGRVFVLTDAFVAHIKDIRHWTVGRELVEEFPFLEGAVNTEPPSV